MRPLSSILNDTEKNIWQIGYFDIENDLDK